MSSDYQVPRIRQDWSRSDREMWIRERHKLYGRLYCFDLDHLLIDRDAGKPLLISESKHLHEKKLKPMSYQAQCMRYIAEQCDCHCLELTYDPERPWWRRVFGLCDKTREVWGKGQQETSEVEYVSWLYELKGEPLPKEVGKVLWDSREDAEARPAGHD